MTYNLEFWGVVLALAAGVVSWAFSIHAKVAVIAASVGGLPEMFREMRQTLHHHEARLSEHDKAIASLKASSDLSG